MDKELIILEMVKYMKENSKMGKCMDMGSLNGQMERCMKENIILEENKDLESL